MTTALSDPFQSVAGLQDTPDEADSRVASANLVSQLNTFLGVAHAVADASITVGAEDANVRPITIQLKKSDGTDCDAVAWCLIAVFTTAAMTAFATGGSTGLAIGTDGALLGIVAKLLFLATSEADGDIDLTWTDTGTESVAVAVILPNGKVVISDAFANT